MATARSHARPLIIDLLSDDEDDAPVPRSSATSAVPVVDLEDDMPFPHLPEHRAPGVTLQPAPQQPAQQEEQPQSGNYQYFGDELVFIPDDLPQTPPAQGPPELPAAFVEEHTFAEATQVLTSDACLQRVLDVFPDVSHEHVLQLFTELGAGDSGMPPPDRYENIVTKLVEADSYPKQSKGKKADLKRKPEDDLKENDFKRWEAADRPAREQMLRGPIGSALKADFPEIPRATIQKQVAEQQYLFQTYVALAAMRDAKSSGWNGRPSAVASADTIVINTGVPELLDELQAARKRVSATRAERTIELARRRAEEENLRRAIAAGETAECQACFDDLPMNRQIHCNGDAAHFTCFDCAITYIKSEVGQSRCGVVCTAGCGASYAHAQLHLLEDKVLLAKLEQLQQEKDIRDADLEDLAECPFCDYKAILPPIEEDFEFRCANPDCEKVSCRRCKATSHIPATCEEHAKDHKLSSRHQIEEAMTAALVRKCGKCSKPFIKDYGCNKMSCPSCGNLQCYVCSASVKDYNHFDQRAPGASTTVANSVKKLCPLYDNVEERHDREIKEAEAKARAEAMAAHPDITEDDLKIKESDAVRKATRDRIRRVGGPDGVRYGHLGGAHGLFNFGAGLAPHDLADLDDEDDEDDEDDLLPQEFLRQEREQREARALNDVLGARMLEQQNVLRMRMLQQQALRARDVPAPPGAGEPLTRPDADRGSWGHGFGGHVAGHGAQAYVGRPRPMYQGLARPQPHPAAQMAVPNVIGYMPVFGMQMPRVNHLGARTANGAQAAVVAPRPEGAGVNNNRGSAHPPGACRTPGGCAVHQQAPAPVRQAQPFGGYTFAQAAPAAPAAPQLPGAGVDNNRGHGGVIGARNNGLRGQQGIVDADLFGGGELDDLLFGRRPLEDDERWLRETLAALRQPRENALGRDAQPGPRAHHLPGAPNAG